MKQNRFAYSGDEGLKVLSEEDILNSFEEKKEIQKGSIEDFFNQKQTDLENQLNKLEKALDLFHEKQLFDQAYETEQRIEKAKKDLTKLIKIKRFITRNGKSFLTTVYVNPVTGEREEKDRIEVKEADRIKDLSTGDFFECKSKKINGNFEVVGINKKDDFAIIIAKEIESGEIKYITPHSLIYFKKIEKPTEKKVEEKKIPTFKELTDQNVELGGSSGVKLYSDSDGELYAVKKSHKGDPDQIKQEAIVSKIYKNFGIKTSDSFYDSESQVLISRYLVGAKEVGGAEAKAVLSRNAIAKEVQKGYVLDCILANHDVIGAAEDNVLIKDGEIYRIDLGGCIEFRAKGAEKHFSDGMVSEISSMKDRNDLFKSISDEDIKEQLAHIVKNKEGFSPIISFIDQKGFEKGERYHKAILSRLKFLCNAYGVDFGKGDIKKVEEAPKDELRPDMPSMTTQKYFDNQWDKVNIEGNPGLKDHIKQHILKIEKKHADNYKRLAFNKRTTVDNIKENMQMWWEELVKRSDGYIVAHSGEKGHRVVDKILISGRFKTQFETGTSEGANDPYGRGETENGYFGFPKYGTDEAENIKHLRPIYGYFTEVEDGILNKEGTIPPPRRVYQYGDVAFKVKKEKFLKDATVTFYDSLRDDAYVAATPASAPHFTSIQPSTDNYDTLKNMYENHAGFNSSYVEAQYHNQLTIDDIESAHISLNEYNRYGGGADLKRVSSVINTITEAVAKASKPVKIKIF